MLLFSPAQKIHQYHAHDRNFARVLNDERRDRVHRGFTELSRGVVGRGGIPRPAGHVALALWPLTTRFATGMMGSNWGMLQTFSVPSQRFISGLFACCPDPHGDVRRSEGAILVMFSLRST